MDSDIIQNPPGPTHAPEETAEAIPCEIEHKDSIPSDELRKEANDTRPAAKKIDVPAPPSALAAHLSQVAREALSLNVEDRIAFARTVRWIPYASARGALKLAADYINAPRTTPMPGMLVLGRPGNGKSTISRRLQKLYEPIVGQDGKVRAPALRVELAPGANYALFWGDLLVSCGSVCRMTDHWLVKRAQVCSMLTSLEPRALILDEVHNLLLGSPRDARHLLAELKWLSNTFSMALILFGTEDASNLLEYDPQMTRRFKHFALPWWKSNPDLANLLDTFETILPLPERSYLSSDEMMQLIDERYDGTIGDLTQVLQEAATLAIRAGRSCIDAKILAQVEGNTEKYRREQRIQL